MLEERDLGHEVRQRRRFLGLLSAGLILKAPPAEGAGSCPGVNPITGVRPALALPKVDPVLPPSRVIPAAWRNTALKIIARFEAGQPDLEAAYRNVATTDVLSLGFLQWNHHSGSLYDQLLKKLGDAAIQGAPKSLRHDVSTLVAVADGRADKAKALEIIERWRVRGGAIAPKVQGDLRAWLASPILKNRQDKLIDQTLTTALQKTDAWVRDSGSTRPNAQQRAFYTFADLEVFSGGSLAGLWYSHVREFRRTFSDDLAMLNYINDWVAACASFMFKGDVVPKEGAPFAPQFRQLYRRKETRQSIAHWRHLLMEKDWRMDDDALDLIALGYLRALMSSGTDGLRGFHGVFQLDVLNRRGMMATGVGVLPGGGTITELYKL